MTITFTETVSGLTATYTGQLNDFTNNNGGSTTFTATSTEQFLALNGAYSSDTSITTPNDPFPWLFLSGGVTTGDAFGVTENAVYAPSPYLSGSTLSGESVWAGKNFGDLGVTTGANGSFNLSVSGDLITWSAVPEPSSYALIVGLVALGMMFARRRLVTV